MLWCEIFGILFSYEQKDIDRFQIYISAPLGWLVTIFYEKSICPKQTQRKKPNKVREAKTVENFKYEPLLKTKGLN